MSENGGSMNGNRSNILSVISIVAIIFTVLGAVAALFKNASDYQRELWEKETGHLARDVEVAKKAMAELDTTLQREMRLINDTTRESLDALDRRLQDEIGRSAEERRAALAVLRDSVRTLEDFMRESIAIHADLKARMEHQETGTKP